MAEFAKIVGTRKPLTENTKRNVKTLLKSKTFPYINGIKQHKKPHTMITFFVTNLGDVKVKATFKGESRTKSFNLWHNKYQIIIETKNGKAYFTFHDCAANITRRTLSNASLLDAVDCILLDIYAYLNDEIKYNYDEAEQSEMRRVERACKKEYESLSRIIGDVDIDTFSDCFKTAYDKQNEE